MDQNRRRNVGDLYGAEDLAGKYLKVVAGAGVNEVEAKTSDKVLKAGAIKLAGVELSASSDEVGATLTAKAYSGSSYNKTYVDGDGVTYTWKKYKGASSPLVFHHVGDHRGPDRLHVESNRRSCWLLHQRFGRCRGGQC